MSDPASDGAATCRVLVSDVHPRLLDNLVTMLLASRADVEVVPPGEGVSIDEVDLWITGAEGIDPRIPRLLVAVNGTDTRLELPYGELSQRVLELAVSASVRHQPARAWYELLLDASTRFDHILTEALKAASASYESGGGFSEWTDAFRAGRTAFGGEPMTGSRLDASILLDGDPAAAIPRESAIGRLVGAYELTPRQVDVLLACLFNELDSRYGQRYAFLVGDSMAPGPTADVLAALFCADAQERLAFLADLTSGVLITSGLIARRPVDVPIRAQVFALDRSILRIFLSDESLDPTDVILDPRLTARASASSTPALGNAVIAAIEGGDLLHVHGGTEPDRRSRVLDIAAAAGCKMLAVPWNVFSAYDHQAAHQLRRDCIRLNVRCVVEGVPRDLDAGALRHLATAHVAITSGPEPLPPGGHAHIRNDEVARPTVDERRMIWESAARWTSAFPADGLEPLVRRFGVSVDRAVDVLVSAASAHEAFTTRQVAELLAQFTMDDAGGMLHALQPRVTLTDLVLADDTRRALIDAKNRIANRDVVIGRLGWDRMTDRLTGTYLMFAGPAGTGKTLAAEALAHELGLPVQLLEISALFSRWVGDFEKHVDRVFAAAQASGALLVVNEADAILGPRTQVLHGQDRYANAGTSHILSRLEQFTGHVVFTTNLLGSNSIDPAFHRRITAVVRFHQPDADQREELWRSVWPTNTRDGRHVEQHCDLGSQSRDDYFRNLARDHPLSGGSIANIARSAAFRAAARNADDPTITDLDMREALKQELTKIGDFRSLMLARVRS
jgi:hypothetical protein